MSQSVFTQTVEVPAQDNLYRDGESMYVLQTATGDVWQNFPLPQNNIYGFCDNFKAPEFLVDVDLQSCSQAVSDVNVAANSFLNAAQYTGFQYSTDQAGTLASPQQGKIYAVAADGTTTEESALPSTAASGCSVTNAVKKIEYTVRYSTDLAQFHIKSVTYDLTVESSLDLCAATADTPALVEMQFAIKFVPEQANANDRIKSGNPGYLSGLPLIVASEVSSTGKTVLPGGFSVQASQANGDCTAVGQAANTESLNFLEDVLLSCQETTVFASPAEFQTYCESYDIANIGMIADILTNVAYVGIFGNADAQMAGDWVEVITSQVNTAQGTYDSERQSCTKMNNLQVEILYSQVGAYDDSQNYIIGAQMSTQESVWIYGSGESYQHFASVTYRFVEPEAAAGIASVRNI